MRLWDLRGFSHSGCSCWERTGREREGGKKGGKKGGRERGGGAEEGRKEGGRGRGAVEGRKERGREGVDPPLDENLSNILFSCVFRFAGFARFLVFKLS